MFWKSALFSSKLTKIKTLHGRRQMLSFSMATLKEDKIIVKNYEVNYLKVGHGPHHVLCAPGSLGYVWTDFKPQIEGFDRDKFSLVVFDAPGCGKTIKLGEDVTQDIFKNYSYIAYHFMKNLQISKYSYLGWSTGGIAGLIHAALYPDEINKLVIWGTSSFLYQHELDIFKKLRTVNNWSEAAVNTLREVYGEENYVERVREWADNIVDYVDSKLSIVDILLRDVTCPTLILYGEKDKLVDKRHAPYLLKKLKNARLYSYPEGRHNIHLQYPEDFNKRVQEFLLEP